MDLRTRAGDADRERTVAELQRRTEEGYLTPEEFAQRSAAAQSATTYGELGAVTADLAPPSKPGRRQGAAGAATRQRQWTTPWVVLVVLLGIVALALGGMVVMMISMMGGGGMGDMGM